MGDLPRFRPKDPSLLADPYPAYRRYREREPVHWGETEAAELDGQWWLFRHEDVSKLLAHPAAGRDWRKLREIVGAKPIPDGAEPLAEMLDRWMLQREGAEHARLRAITGRAFTPRTVERLRPKVERTAAELLAAIDPGEPFELVERYARPFSALVMGELLGIPAGDQDRVGAWIRGLGPAFAGERGRRRVPEAGRMALELAAYLAGLFDARRREPCGDLLSDLAAEDAQERFDRAEAVATCMLLVGAGYTTVVHFLSNSTHALLDAPDVLETLRAAPERFEASVDELLRFDGPAHGAIRYVSEPVELGGRTIEANSLIVGLVAAANRDPEVFPDPDRIDLDRDARAHLGFGRGPHFCLGAALARLEGGVGLRALFERFGALQMGDEPPRWGQTIGRGIDRLVVRG